MAFVGEHYTFEFRLYMKGCRYVIDAYSSISMSVNKRFASFSDISLVLL